MAQNTDDFSRISDRITTLGVALSEEQDQDQIQKLVKRAANIITRYANARQTSTGANHSHSAIKLWYRLAKDLMLKSDHPTKKVAALLIDNNNKLVSWGVNSLPAVFPKDSIFLKEGERKKYILCAEQACLVRYRGLDSRPIDVKPRKRVRAKDLKIFAAYKSDLLDDLRQKPTEANNLRGMSMIVTSIPCETCCEILGAQKLSAVWYGNQNTGIKRYDPKKSLSILQDHKIASHRIGHPRIHF